MKKYLIFTFLIISLIIIPSNFGVVYAVDGETEKPYVVYTETGEYLFEKSDVQLKDNYISKNFDMYEINSVNKETNTATAIFVKKLKKPNIKVNPNPNQISATDRKICLYMTHNDESYVPSDGYDSIYGEGGIHDVAKALKNCFELMGVNTVLDETLHIPHNSSAYSRSEITAKKLLKTHSPDAMFDIHRDGVNREYYVTEYAGKERCQIRITVGQANPNKEQNLEFALYLMSVAEESYPWLFADIYYAAGHYNQALSNKVLLFEMGTYLIEKELVFDSVYPLAEVINTALFNTTIDTGTGDITIGGSDNPENPTVNDHLNNMQEKNKNTGIVTAIVISISFVSVIGTIILVSYFVNKSKKK